MVLFAHSAIAVAVPLPEDARPVLYTGLVKMLNCRGSVVREDGTTRALAAPAAATATKKVGIGGGGGVRNGD